MYLFLMSWSVIVDMPRINNKTHSHEFRYTIRLYNMIYLEQLWYVYNIYM